MMLWRLLGLLAGAVSQRINNATKSSCAGHGCGRAAVALVGGFSDVTFHRDGKYDAAHATNPKKPLLAAWLDVTAQSNKYHVQRPLATAYGGADFFIYSWDASLEGAYAARYAPTAAAFADNAPVLARIPHLKATRPRSCESDPNATKCTKPLAYHERFRSVGHMHVASACVETIISRRRPRHRRDACSMAWRCRFLTTRRTQASASWAFAVREVHGLIAAHEKSRGFDYEAVYFGRPDVLMWESLPARALLDDEVFMPRPGWGDFFFYMRRLKARKFSKMYTVAETR